MADVDRRIERQLRRGRSTPGAEFGTGLAERLRWLEVADRRPSNLRTLVLVYAACGVLLLLLALLGAVGAGPFA